MKSEQRRCEIHVVSSRKVLSIFALCLFAGILYAQDARYPFASDIRRFKEIDSINPPPKNAVLFIGSSSFTLWKNIQESFPEFTVINRGFGGSQLTDQIRYADDIIFPYSPRHIVIYCGENDLAASDSVTPAMVHDRFVTLFETIRHKLPDARITYISLKPSPLRWHLAGKFTEANRSISEFLKKKPEAGFVNIWDSMLTEHSLPDSSLFLEDMLHMNQKGYAIWQRLIKPELESSDDRTEEPDVCHR